MGLRYSVNLENVDVHTAPLLESSHSYRSHGRFSKPETAVTYACQYCLTHLTVSGMVLSDQYRGKTGDAFLVHNVVNVINGKKEFRQMTTGAYTVCDILCHQCHSVVGWKYLKSNEKDMKFKEGKYILEVNTICSLD
ncbi:unnamed protein product [Kuraishia capsulata CBS 1993]|uniref:Protein yippee-like n=1 Tax=Kuraishia capsulata CBS 1993 TaxID=1382522 RepID=W6MJC5_9ASCO|nr:uncharacterized protein KUCA_T00000481001 [Kuraishia capsulata CBS 1993]CDK24517.1 unnamed protein product [Kuraishia capsulata CBS 1993]